MKLINESPYDTRVLRRILCRVHAAAKRREKWVEPDDTWKKLHVLCVPRANLWYGTHLDHRGDYHAELHLPKLTGAEFINLLRQQHSASGAASAGLSSLKLAVLWQKIEYAWRGHAPTWVSNILSQEAEKALKGVPEFVPLRVIEPEAPRDKLRDRYKAEQKLVRVWTRKCKLANTKLKLHQTKLKRCAKQLAAREEVPK